MGGRDESRKSIKSSYILEVFFNANTITNIEYKDMPNVPHFFSAATFGSFKGRNLIMGGFNSKKCLEFEQEELQENWEILENQYIPSLNACRCFAASTFIQNKVVVAGGSKPTPLDTIEILDWDESNHGSQWIQSPSRLPIVVHGHTLVTLNDKLFLIAGHDGSNRLDKIWRGRFDKLNNRISWVEMGLSFQTDRARHVSFVSSNQIFTFGGLIPRFGPMVWYHGNDVVEILEGNKLKQGPKVPFELNTVYDQAVLDRNNRVIVTSKHHGLIVYDHQAGTFTRYDNFKLREERQFYAAILQ